MSKPSTTPKPPEPQRPPGPIPPPHPPSGQAVVRLLPEAADGMGGWERESAASINEAMFPFEAISQRCALAGYKVDGYPLDTSTTDFRFMSARGAA